MIRDVLPVFRFKFGAMLSDYGCDRRMGENRYKLFSPNFDSVVRGTKILYK